MIADLILTNAHAYVANAIVDCSIAIDHGRILKIGKETTMPQAAVRINLKNTLILPGLIDAHVHLRDEGRAHKETFYTGTSAAAAGGLTTILDMPNNDPVTMNAQSLRNRMEIASEQVVVNVGFYSEFPENTKELQAIVKEGAVAFKLFMANQVGGLNIDDDSAILEAFRILGKLGRLVAVHAEDHTWLEKAEEKLRGVNRKDIEAFLEAHSESVEEKAVKRILNIAKQTTTHTHFCHVSTKNGLKAIVDGRKRNLSVTCETTPHNLFLSAEDLKRIGMLGLTMPPVREEKHVGALWDGIRKGCIDIIASDHAPHTLEEKMARSVWDAKVGIPGLETTLPLLLTAVNQGKLSIADVVRLMSKKPAEIFKLKGRGHIKENNNADLTAVDMKRKYRINAAKFHSKAQYSPFDGWQVEGKPIKTFVNGQLTMDDGVILSKPGSGDIIRGE